MKGYDETLKYIPMKPLRALPQAERKKVFWASFVAIAGITIVFWAFVFFKKDIERFQAITLPDVSRSDFAEELGSLKKLGNVFKENVDMFRSLTDDLKSLGGDLTEEEQMKLDEWGHAKESRGEEITFEETMNFLTQLRGTGTTTMPIEKQKAKIKNQNGE